MTPTYYIMSPKNQKVKDVCALQQKSKVRKEKKQFVVEGRRELQHCIDAGMEVQCFFQCPELQDEETKAMMEKMVGKVELTAEEVAQTHHTKEGVVVYTVIPATYKHMVYREGTEGIAAVVKAVYRSLEDLQLPENPLLVVVESVEKPGNLGAILRSADAAKADAVIVCDPLTDLYNPNVIRASIGAVFTVPCVACTSEECIAFLKERNIQILTAQLQDSHLYYDTDMRRGTALVMGTESTGLTDIWREAADAHIRIPMLGKLDSLNVSVSAAILLYEAVRQRENREG